MLKVGKTYKSKGLFPIEIECLHVVDAGALVRTKVKSVGHGEWRHFFVSVTEFDHYEEVLKDFYINLYDWHLTALYKSCEEAARHADPGIIGTLMVKLSGDKDISEVKWMG